MGSRYFSRAPRKAQKTDRGELVYLGGFHDPGEGEEATKVLKHHEHDTSLHMGDTAIFADV